MKNKKITPKNLPQPCEEVAQTNCPRCGNSMQEPFVALCRRDNKTKICPDCGTNQALQDILTPKLNKNQKPETIDNLDLPRENQKENDNQKLATVSVAPKNPNQHIAIPSYNADGTIRTKEEEYHNWMMWNLRECTIAKEIQHRPSIGRQMWVDFVWAVTTYDLNTDQWDFQRRRAAREVDELYLRTMRD